ncbi:MAG: hypothetical protein ACYC5O_21910 [Anaerolineae bacterium]
MDGRTPAGDTALETIKNAGNLRDHLARTELAIAGLKRATADEAANIVRMVDVAEKAIPRLEERFSVELKPERARLQILETRLSNNATLLVQRAGARRLQQMRRETEPEHDEWWWRLDQTVAEQRGQRLRHLGVRIGIGVAVLLVVAVVYQVFLAPSVESRGTDQRLSDAEGYLIQGRLEAALTEYMSVLDARPEDAAATAAVAAILDQLGRADEAEPYFARAEALAASPADYYADLSMAYYRMSQQGTIDAVAKAEQAANQAIAADPQSAKAYLALGGVYELQNRIPEAIEALQTASGLSTDAALTAAIQIRVAMLSQRPGDLPTFEVETSQPQ